MNAIEMKGLTKCYGKARGVTDLDLTVGEGEFFGFIGPNGAGKSTTIRTMLGLIRPNCGSVRIFGRDISTDRKSILSDVGYLPSESAFYTGMRVREIIRLSADLRGLDCGEDARVLCDRLELNVCKRVDELSLGNRKKVSVVCALQHNPKLLVLDEPTGGLDPLMQREFFNILKERNESGATVFISSHILSEIQRNCTRAAIVRDGRIVACDSMEKLFRTSAKRVTLHGRAVLDGLDGIRDLHSVTDGVSFLYSGSLTRLLEVLARGEVKDLSIAEPDLEEVFMHYYENGDSNHATV